MNSNQRVTFIQYIFGFLTLGLAILRLINFESMSLQFDNTFLVLFIVSAVLFLIPLDRIKAFKAGGVEFEFLESRVQGALEGLSLRPIDNRRILDTLNSLKTKIRFIQNSRVLWIDDKPHEILGERRLLRSLGLEVITSNNEETTKEILELDNDFDLIISDIQWRDPENAHRVTYGGINMISQLRNQYKDRVIGSIPIIYYTAYSAEQLQTIDNQTGFKSMTDIEICGTIEELLVTAIHILSQIRCNPVKVKSKKKPT